MSKKRKKRLKWSDFPEDKVDENDFYCGHCKLSSDVQNCRYCRKRCRKWCPECEEYASNENHLCFVRSRKKQNTEYDFPVEKDGEYYCAECEKGNDIRDCRTCGKSCWRWCDNCDGYVSTYGHKCFSKKKMKKKRLSANDFPDEKSHRTKNYHCGHCDVSSRTKWCGRCKKACWKWCESCESYKSHHHPCFSKANKSSSSSSSSDDNDGESKKIGKKRKREVSIENDEIDDSEEDVRYRKKRKLD